MPHARQQIREAFGTAVTGLTTTGSNVYESRVYPFDTLPCLAIYTLSEQTETEYSTSTAQARQLSVVVEARAKANANLDDTLDQIAAEVEAAIHGDAGVSALVVDYEIEGTEIELEAEGEKPTGVLRMSYAVLYRVNPADPTASI